MRAPISTASAPCSTPWSPAGRPSCARTLWDHLVEPPEPPSRYAAEPLPRELDELVLQALAKSPDERFESASAMAYALRQIVPSASDYRDAPTAVQLRSSDEASRALWVEEGGEDPPATAADLDKPAHAVSDSRQAAGLSANAAQAAALAPTVAAVAGLASGAGAAAAPALPPQAGPPQVCEPGRRYGGRYVVEELLARGGIAEIYRVRHAVTGGKYAFKVLQARLRRRSDIVARLRGEALALAALKSPHVVQVIDCDEDPAVGLFVVMELIDGMSLREVMNALRSRGRSLTMLQALDYVLETADALSALHLVGIIHRDLKPENIHVLRTPDGERLLKLLDLGAAKNYQSVAVVTDGNIVATPKYASPEHLAGKPTGPWSDVYSLGHVAYELLAGRHAFDGLDAGPMGMGYIGMHLFHPIAPLAEIDPRVPQFVSAIVERATAKEPWLRWPSMAALADEIREAIGKLTGKRVVRATPREHEADLAEVLQMRSGVAGGGGPGDLGPGGLGRGVVGPAGTAVIDLAPGEPSLVGASSCASTTTTVVMRREAAEPLAPSPGLPAVAWRAPAPPPPVASPAVPVVASPARPLVASTPAPSPLALEEPWGLTVLASRDRTLRPGTHFCVLGSFVALGWHSKAKLRVLDDKLMPLHCGVLRRGDCCIIAHPERLPPAIEHAGELVREATLDPGGVVRVGETNLRFWLAPEPADGPRILVLGSEASPSQQERYAQSLPQARLVVLESLSVLRDDDGACNPDPGTEIEIACPRFTFGWAAGADLTLIDPEIEHLHAVITAEQGRHRLVAFGPRPITVDGQPCHERWLEPGARIEVGRTVLAYAEGGASCVRATTSRLAASRGPNVSGRPAGGRRKGGAGP
jgi:serine/threonine protein kinase